MTARFSACVLLFATLLVAIPASASSVPGSDNHVSSVLFALTVILIGAKLGGLLASVLGQPAVLGELTAGIVIGNLSLLGVGWFELFREMPSLQLLAELGVILLLFEVGLHLDMADMLRVGLSALLVACAGIAAPFVLGWAVGALFYPSESVYMHVFLGAILTATSVGITARVLRDMGKLGTDEARIILGAAVLDDVIGLLVLALITGIIQAANAGSAMSAGTVFWLGAKALLFFAVAALAGRVIFPRVFRLFHAKESQAPLLVWSLAVCFLFAYLAQLAGLAPIIGAFAAGLTLDRNQLGGRNAAPLTETLAPLTLLFAPVFFVVTGMGVDVSSFGRLHVIGFALVLTLVAVVGKLIAGVGVTRRAARTASRWIVGIGMIPRGEVGLIFASIGAALTFAGRSVVSPEVYSAAVLMVVLTTALTPPLLAVALGRKSK